MTGRAGIQARRGAGCGRGRGGSRARKWAAASWTRWREAALVWAFDAGRLHTRLAYAALRALGGDKGVGGGLRFVWAVGQCGWASPMVEVMAGVAVP
ncbi:MAG: hypothetical protein IT169_13110 [Bryobacterales bacterium]|nr:hypothetical protein [Bryobacterales bacterium]